jgi:hypothetical protein
VSLGNDIVRVGSTFEIWCDGFAVGEQRLPWANSSGPPALTRPRRLDPAKMPETFSFVFGSCNNAKSVPYRNTALGAATAADADFFVHLGDFGYADSNAYSQSVAGYEALWSDLLYESQLARLAERLQLGDHLLLGRGEERTGGRRKQALLADTYEAVIAALYLDGGLDAARAFLVREFDDIMRESAVDGGMGDDHKSVLQELLQSHGDPLPEYVVVAESGPAHRRVFRIELRVRGDVIAVAEGRTKKDAEQEAARLGRQSLID